MPQQKERPRSPALIDPGLIRNMRIPGCSVFVSFWERKFLINGLLTTGASLVVYSCSTGVHLILSWLCDNYQQADRVSVLFACQYFPGLEFYIICDLHRPLPAPAEMQTSAFSISMCQHPTLNQHPMFVTPPAAQTLWSRKYDSCLNFPQKNRMGIRFL